MEKLLAIYREAANGSVDAYAFIIAWNNFVHAVDDLVDGDAELTPANLLAVLHMANTLYSTPFYVGNSAALSAIVVHINNTYADSIIWESSNMAYQQKVADVIRQCGNDMVMAVANITGGYIHMRSISTRLRDHTYHLQHEPTYGN